MHDTDDCFGYKAPGLRRVHKCSGGNARILWYAQGVTSSGRRGYLADTAVRGLGNGRTTHIFSAGSTQWYLAVQMVYTWSPEKGVRGKSVKTYFVFVETNTYPPRSFPLPSFLPLCTYAWAVVCEVTPPSGGSANCPAKPGGELRAGQVTDSPRSERGSTSPVKPRYQPTNQPPLPSPPLPVPPLSL